jgi:hypothetical protein
MTRSTRTVYGTTIAPPPGGARGPVAYESATEEPLAAPVMAPSLVPPTVPGVGDTDADEAAIVYVLRLLNQTCQPRRLTPVEYAFVTGARAMFAQFTKVCDDLLKKGPVAQGASLAAATVAPTAEAFAAATDEERERPSRSRRRPVDTPTAERT